MLTKKQLLDTIHAQQLSNKVISLHSAYRSFGSIEGGPDSLIDAFLESGCTLLVPTFTYGNDAYPPLQGEKYAQNGVDLNAYQDALKGLSSCFVEGSQQISKEMGIIPKLILARKTAFRGYHPVNSFTAIGPLAEQLIEKQDLLALYAPFEQCLSIQGATLLLIGVDFCATTPIHFAEQKAGRRLFRAWANIYTTEQKQICEVQIGSCSDGFNQLIPRVSHIQKSTQVGESLWQSYPFKAFIDTCAEVIQQQPSITQCANSHCIRCRDAILGGPLLI